MFKEGKLTQSEMPMAFSITERVLDADEPIFTSMDVKPITQDRLVAVNEEGLRNQLALIGQKIYRQLSSSNVSESGLTNGQRRQPVCA